jgi:hypothetical protein
VNLSYESFIAVSGLLDQPALILCATKGCTTEPEAGCDHCATCLEAFEAPTQTNLQEAA